MTKNVATPQLSRSAGTVPPSSASAVTSEPIFPNCPCYIQNIKLLQYSAYAPRPEYKPPVPAGKTFEVFRDALPACEREEDT